jgi:hypothetical protein
MAARRRGGSTADTVAMGAVKALNDGKPAEARDLLKQALADTGERPDLLHALAVVEMQIGEIGEARPHVDRALALLRDVEGAEAAEMRQLFTLTSASIAQEEDDPAVAEAVCRELLAVRPDLAPARSTLASVLFALGRLDAGRAEMEVLAVDPRVPQDERAGARAFVEALDRWRTSGEHPRAFLVAHRERYCRFFDAMARDAAAKGWIAEAAIHARDAGGATRPLVPEGARPYATVRVDLVDPATGQRGLVGDQPMVVARRGWEPLARIPVVLPWPGAPFDLRVSTQAPWDELPVQVLLEDGDPLERVDPVVGAWYADGFEGRFGEADRGRFHYVGDLERTRAHGAVWRVDLGRARVDAVDALVERLEALHRETPLNTVILGRGSLPPDPPSTP